MAVPGIGNGFVKSVNWTEGKKSFLVAILNENPEFYLDEVFFFIHPPYGAN
jgi:hypothetical protein